MRAKWLAVMCAAGLMFGSAAQAMTPEDVMQDCDREIDEFCKSWGERNIHVSVPRCAAKFQGAFEKGRAEAIRFFDAWWKEGMPGEYPHMMSVSRHYAATKRLENTHGLYMRDKGPKLYYCAAHLPKKSAAADKTAKAPGSR